MGAIKSNDYDRLEMDLSLIGRAVGHPARVKILKLLKEQILECRNVDLASYLKFSKPNVKRHLDFLNDAGMIEVEYFVHYYNVRLSSKGKRIADLVLVDLGERIS